MAFIPSTIETQQRLATLFETLHGQMLERGVSVHLCDPAGNQLRQAYPPGGACELLFGDEGPCRSLCQDVAQAVVESGQSVKAVGPAGGVVLGAPVLERRRLVATITIAYLPGEMLDQQAEEDLHAACDRWRLDYAAVVAAARGSRPPGRQEADHLLKALELSIQNGLSLQIAADDVSKLSLNLAMTYEELSFVYHISNTMKLTNRPEAFFEREVCQGLLEVLDVQAVVAIVRTGGTIGDAAEVFQAGQTSLTDAQLQAVGEALSERLVAEPRRLVENNPSAPAGVSLDSFAAVPVVQDDAVGGILLAISKQDEDFSNVDVKLMRAIADQAAVFMTNHRLYADLQDLLLGVLDALTASIDAKDPYTCGHSRRVALVSRRLAEGYGLPTAKIERIYLAGLLHDVGKIGVPESILRKPGRLTDEEFEAIQLHPVTSARILGGIRQMEDVLDGMLHHHERMDGRGYPDGLAGEAFPIEARIIGLADCFDAMTSDRVYRKALPLPEVIEEIRSNAGTQFDRDLVDILLGMDLEAFLADLRREDDRWQREAANMERQK